jgi:hypothetical protein
MFKEELRGRFHCRLRSFHVVFRVGDYHFDTTHRDASGYSHFGLLTGVVLLYDLVWWLVSARYRLGG